MPLKYQVVEDLNKKFTLETFESLNLFHGFEATKDSSSLYLTQTKCTTTNSLKKTNITRASSLSSPMAFVNKLSFSQ